MTPDTCTKCGVEIREFLTGRKSIAGKPYCRNCFYEEVGAVVEQNPFGLPRAPGASR